MKIRLWENFDCQAVADLEKDCFSDPWSIKAIEETCSRRDFIGLVLEEDGKVQGYVGCLFAFDQADVLLIAVNPTYRGKGYGKLLLEKALGVLKINQVKNVFLEVRKSNLVARSCYEGRGFKEIAVRKGYYSDGEDAIIMEKEI